MEMNGCQEEDVRDYPEINSFCAMFNMEQDTRLSILKKFTSAMEMGLSGDCGNREKSSLKMVPTFVTKVPSLSSQGTETAHYGVDLGGTNLRVLYVRFEHGRVIVTARHEELGHDLITGPAEAIFDKIADLLAVIAHSNEVETSASFHDPYDSEQPRKVLDLGVVGFTFSFPTTQESLFSGKLIHWTKGYTSPGAVNNDVSKMLMDSIAKNPHISARNVALLNDTTGTMLCGAMERTNVVSGLIQGTGCNACYIEETCRIEKLSEEEKSKSLHMIINTEFGGFGSKGELDCVKTVYDKALDAKSNNPGQQTLEKMVAGMYMGELARLCILDMKEKGIAFRNSSLSKLSEPGTFSCSDISSIEDFDFTAVFTKFEIEENPENTYALAALCRGITVRCAKLLAVAMVGLLSKTPGNRKTIAADGSVITKHPTMKEEIISVMKNLKPNWKVTIHLTTDGSGKGAGILASML